MSVESCDDHNSFVVNYDYSRGKNMKRDDIKKFLESLGIKYEEYPNSLEIKINTGTVIGDGWASAEIHFGEDDNYKNLEITGD